MRRQQFPMDSAAVLREFHKDNLLSWVQNEERVVELIDQLTIIESNTTLTIIDQLTIIVKVAI